MAYVLEVISKDGKIKYINSANGIPENSGDITSSGQ